MDAFLLDSLFSNSAEGIVVFNKKMDLIYFNNPILNIIPNLPEEPHKKDFSSIIGFALEANKEVNVDLFELDYLISVEKRIINNGGNIFNVFRFKKIEKDYYKKC